MESHNVRGILDDGCDAVVGSVREEEIEVEGAFDAAGVLLLGGRGVRRGHVDGEIYEGTVCEAGVYAISVPA